MNAPWLSVILFTTLWGAPLSAKNLPIKIGNMTLSFHADKVLVPKNFRETLSKNWADFCENLGANFLVGKGPQGRGIAGKIECLAVDFAGNFDKNSANENLWQIAFTWNSKGLTLGIYYRMKGKNSEAILLKEIVLPKKMTPDFLFASQESKFYVVGKVYRNLPVGWTDVFSRDTTKWQKTPLDRWMSSVLIPAQKLGLFSLAYNPENKMWVPSLYGVAEPLRGDKAIKDFDRLGDNPFEIRWIKPPSKAKVRLWMQEIYNPLETEDTTFLSDQPSPSQGLMEAFALDGLLSNTITFRYGTPYPKGKSVAGQAKKLEFILNIEQGLLKGFHLEIEHSPRLELIKTDEIYSYTWTRSEAGWSFILGVPITIDNFASRFRLTPKIGVLSFDARFPLAAEEDSDFNPIATYTLSRQLEFGGEFSWELEALSYRWKLWATAHLSGYALAPKLSTKVSNQRAGGDFSYEILKSRDGLKVNAMTFGYIDWVTLQSKEAANESEPELAEATSASTASFSATYFGLGVSVTW